MQRKHTVEAKAGKGVTLLPHCCLRVLQDISKEDFELPTFGPKLEAARDEVCYILSPFIRSKSKPFAYSIVQVKQLVALHLKFDQIIYAWHS